MMEFSRWKIGLVAFAAIAGLLLSVPNFLTPSARDSIKGFLPTQTVNLGLDLQGGSYLLIEVNTDKLAKDDANNRLEALRSELKNGGVGFSNLSLNGSVIRVTIDKPEQMKLANDIARKLVQPIISAPGTFDMSVSQDGANQLVLTMTSEGIKASAVDAVDSSLVVIRNRLDNTGTKEIIPVRQGFNRIVVEAPGQSDPESLKRIIGKTARLTFQMVDENVSPSDLAAGLIPPGTEVLPSADGVPLAVRKRVIVSGDELEKSSVTTDQMQRPAIGFQFDSAGAKKFGLATAQNAGKRFAIILDGEIVSAPVINEPILGGSGIIQGNFAPEEAKELVDILNGGSLKAELKVEEQRTVTAQLGADSVEKGAIATGIAFLCVLIFMLLAYGFLFGGISVVALLVNMVLLVGSMSLMQSTLTLPGIAGLILTLAMAVDANVLIFERMRDEARAGRPVITALDAGFSRAFETILDANITTIVAAIIMFSLGAGPVRGFSVTLVIGTITSVFSAVMVTQVVLSLWYRLKSPKRLPIADDATGEKQTAWPLIKKLPQKTNFNFVAFAKFAATGSAIAVVVSLFMALYPLTPPCGGLNCGVDFKGGTLLEVNMGAQKADLGTLRAAMNKTGVEDVQVQGTNEAHRAFIRFETPEGGNASDKVEEVKAKLKAQFPTMSFAKTEVVGAKVSGELLQGGIIALFVAIGLMMIYIWFRFEWQFGLGAVFALFHDVILTFGLFAIFKLPFDLTAVAAILTIIGYSMNDTVVVFDRLRENLRKYKKMPLRELIDLSINETLSRTIITGITAFMALFGLAMIGGEVLFAFSVAMMFGIVIGTYSSIYVATPVILLWGVNRNMGDAEVIDLGGHRPKGSRNEQLP